MDVVKVVLVRPWLFRVRYCEGTVLWTAGGVRLSLFGNQVDVGYLVGMTSAKSAPVTLDFGFSRAGGEHVNIAGLIDWSYDTYRMR